jgi:hypothetical protein
LYKWVLLREGYLRPCEPKGVPEPQENPGVQEPPPLHVNDFLLPIPLRSWSHGWERKGTRSVIDLCLENGTHLEYFHWNSGDPGSVLLGLPVPLFQNVRLLTHGEKQTTTQIRRIYVYSLM